MLCRNCLGGRLSFSLLRRYRQNPYVTFCEYSKSLTKDETENVIQNDLGVEDIFGIEQLKDHTYSTEPIDSHRAMQYKNINVTRLTQKAMDKINPKSTTQDVVLPYGNVRFDKKISKGFADVDIRIEREQTEFKDAQQRKKGKELRKIQRHETKYEICENVQHDVSKRNESLIYGEDMLVTKSEEYGNLYAENIGKIFEDQTNELPFGESNVLTGIDNTETHPLDHDLSYMDQAYFGKADIASEKKSHLKKEDTHFGYIDGQYFDSNKPIEEDMSDKSLHGNQFPNISSNYSADHDELTKESSKGFEAVDNLTDSRADSNVDELSLYTKDVTIKSEKKKYKVDNEATLQELVNEQSHLDVDSGNKTSFPDTLFKSESTKVKKEERKSLSDIFNNQIGFEANKNTLSSPVDDDYEEPSDLEKVQAFQDLKTSKELGNRRARYSKKKRINDEDMSSAYNASRQIRNEFTTKEHMSLYGRANPKEYDNKGLRILTKQTPEFKNVPRIDVIKVLRQNILFDNRDIVAISKPYGIPLQGGVDGNLSIDSFLSSIIPSTTLHSIDTMESDVTGVMLFGKTKEIKDMLMEKMERGEICKKFLTITKNVPSPLQGDIDIPIVERIINGKHRMALRPQRTAELAKVLTKSKPGRDAVTRYRVLFEKDNSYALLECIPLTFVKHQIRAHLALGLNCPILGDHKYSHMNKLAPMNLHPIMLERLKIQQSKVRYLALHLHCRSIVIPNMLDGRNLFVTAPFSVHFLANMRDLKLKLPPNA